MSGAVAEPAVPPGAPEQGTPELAFGLHEVVPDERAVAPTLLVRVRVDRVDGGPVRCLALTAVLGLAAARRGYDEATRRRLVGLFGEPDRWGTTLRTLTWAQHAVMVPAFTGTTVVTLPVVCGHDPQLAAATYLHAVPDGDVPIEIAVRGTVFYPDARGLLRTGQIPWHHQVDGRFPVAIWRQVMDRYYGDSRWLRLDRDTVDRLAAYQARHALTCWGETVAHLLRAAGGDGAS